MLRYLKLYGSFLRICLIREMESRGNFIVANLVIVLFPLFPLLFIGAIYKQVSSLSGWTLYQYLLLVGTFQLINGIIFAMFFKNVFEMPENVRKGQLDFYLLKPVNSQFMLSTRYIAFTELSGLLPGIILIAVALANLNLDIDWWRWPLYVLFIVSGVIIGYSIWFITAIPCIWFVKLESNEIFFALIDMGRYHPNMFSGIIKTVLVYLIPVGVIAATPADLLLNRLDWTAALWSVGIAALLLYFSHRFWRFAQTRYYGASS